MKKLMIAAAALMGGFVCGTAHAEDGAVTSQNIVGYQSITLEKGFNVMSGTFLGMEPGETLNIQDIVLKGDSIVAGTDNIQLLNENSVSYVTYSWADEYTTPVWVEQPAGSGNWVGIPGWVSEDGMSLLDWDMPAAQGFVIYSENGGTTINIAGQVKDSNKEYVTTGGFTVLGNFNPTTLNIQNITLSGENVVAGTDNIQLLNENSVSYVTYSWADEYTTPVWVEEPAGSGNWVGIPGWVSEDGMSLLDWDMPAGQGFVLFTQNAGVTVTIPSYKNATK